MRQILARAFKSTRKKKAAVAKLVDSANILQVILQTISQHHDVVSKLATQRSRTDESFEYRETGKACGKHAGEFPQLTATPNPTRTSSTDEAGSTPGTINLVNSVRFDAKLDLTSHDHVSQSNCEPNGDQHMADSGTPCGGNLTTVEGARGLDHQILQGARRTPGSADDLACSSASSFGSSRRAAHRLHVGGVPVPKLLLHGLAGPSKQKNLTASSGPGPSPLATHSTASSMHLSAPDPAPSKLPQGWHLVVPGESDYDSSHSVSFRDAVASHLTAEGSVQPLGERLLSGADSVMRTPIRNSGSSQTAEPGARFARTHISPSKLSSIVTPCSSIGYHNAGTPGGSFSANMNYASPAAISTALLHTMRSVPGTRKTSVQSQDGEFTPHQQVITNLACS